MTDTLMLMVVASFEWPSLNPNDYTRAEMLNLLVTAMIAGLRQYYWILTLRLSIQWFPNINPYIHPMYSLLHATDFFLKEFDDIVPTVLGMDMSSMCAFIFLEWIIRTLESITFTEPPIF
uniref:Ycf19 n=1 Tax=Laminaria rodriguezii TaxID=1740620 RepID=A0A7U1G3K5_9PHAE|nr:Ycf19 [Laminaria rodriguezii]QQY85069.1 Ycf19 [Laminaria rodriguezii]